MPRPILTSLALSLCLLTVFPQTARAESESKPNVIVIMADGQGYGDVKAHGHPFIRTPQSCSTPASVESDSVRRANEQPLTTSANTGWNTQTEMNP